MTNRPFRKPAFLITLFLISFLTLFILRSTFLSDRNSSLQEDPLSVATITSLCPEELEAIEATKTAWAEQLATHPFYPPQEREMVGKKPKKKAGFPDLAFNQHYLKTMDPALGAVPYDRLMKASREVERLLKNRAPIAGVTWHERGPNNVAGRGRACMFDPNDATKKKVWAGSVGGGLWYTNDITVANPVWNKVNDFWDNIAVSTIAFNPNNTQEFYVGTGEGWFNNDAQNGGGIWKSANGGGSWSLLASTVPGAYNSGSDFHAIQKIVIKSNGTIFAATRGYYTNTGGIMRSTNGGTNWTKVLTAYTGAGTLYDWAADLEVAANGDVYCSFGIYSEGKVFKTTNANNGNAGTWTDLSSNVAIGNAQRIELACAPSNSNVIYAVGQGGSGANDIEWFKKSTTGGTTWTSVTIPKIVDDGVTHFTKGQAWYDLILAVHPTNENLILAGGVDLHRSTNGGTNWTGITHWQGQFGKPYVHADQHNIQFRPNTPDEVLFLNDGGVYYSTNAGNSGATPSFSSKNKGLNVTQFYSAATRNEFNSQYFLAGSQDNGTQQFTQPQIGSTTLVVNGDGGYCQIDSDNSNIQLATYIYNNVYRSLNGGISFAELFNNATGHFINPNDYDNLRNTLYAASNNDLLKRVTGLDGGFSNNDIAVSVGGAKITALKVSPYNDVLFIGIENARVYKLTNASNGTPTVTRIDNGAVPISSSGWVSSIDVGESDNHVMVTYSNYGVASIWQTSNGGANWYNKEGNIPDIPVNWAIYNPSNRNQVLAATELGVWSTDNFGPTTNAVPVWGVSSTGLAYTRCDMLEIRPSDKQVVVATHGRGLFTTDIFVTSPTSDFVYNTNATCNGSITVQFTDISLKPNGSWQWDIDNNNTTDYTTQNASHTYSTPGVYSVTLKINGGATTTTKTNLIHVFNTPPVANTGCTVNANANNGNNGAIGITRFKVGNLDYVSLDNDGHYQNYTCSQGTSLLLNTLYPVTIRTGVYNSEGARFYIDYNNNGTFEGSESAVSFPSNTEGTRTLNFTTPSTGVISNKNLRARVLSKFTATPSGPCDVGDYGQAEDYIVHFRCQLTVTLASGSGEGSLRAAIQCANPGDTVRLSSSLIGQTINIGATPILINKNLVMVALGPNIGITGSGNSVFEISAGSIVEISGIHIHAGTSLAAGAIQNSGHIKLVNTNIYRNVNQMNGLLINNLSGAQVTTFGMCFLQ